jgi:succinoglycan biosynthesis protein ExoW
MQVAIIIPFYQREKGILNNCLNSVFLQEGSIEYSIFIVNDESPVSPEQEISSFSSQQQSRISIINRKNGGPGKARNTALDTIDPPKFEYIAFIDSDDQWEPSHLQTAVNTLSQGYDFYFANFFQLNNDLSVMEKAQKNGKFNPAKHEQIFSSTIYLYKGDFSAQIICANLIGTSSVVYRTSISCTTRFDQNFYFAGEDYLFWLALTNQTKNIVFNTVPACNCGQGVNIYSSNGLGAPFALERIRDELKYLKLTKKLYPLPPQSEPTREQKIQSLKTAALNEIKHRIFRVKSINPKTLHQICKLVITR